MLLHGDTQGLHLPLQPGYCSQHSEYTRGLNPGRGNRFISSPKCPH